MSEHLERAVQNASIVVVLGTGVTAHATAQSPSASWEGLVWSAAARAQELSNANESLDEAIQSLMKLSKTSGSPEPMIQAASVAASALNKIGAQAYATWLEDTIGSLKIVDDTLLKAIGRLPYPILTTNYDTILETVSGRRACTWRDTKNFQLVLNKNSNDVCHIHGVWNEPESVIFTEKDYEALNQSDAATALMQSLFPTTSILYIGVGEGTSDPHFSLLQSWYEKLFPVSATKHFRLCRQSEIKELERLHANSNIFPIAYGEAFEDLPSYIESLLPPPHEIHLSEAGIARDLSFESQAALETTLIEDALIAESSLTDDPLLSEVILPPVLLPVPYSQYVQAKSSRSNSQPIERLNAGQESESTEALLIVADEDSGLTTAIRWLTLMSARARGNHAPICIDFENCPSGLNPLHRQVQVEATSVGAIPTKKDPLPPHILGLDNFSPYVTRISERVAQELGSSKASKIIVGCRLGVEDDALEMLMEAGLNPRIRYIGGLEFSDIEKLAKVVSKKRSRELSENVLDFLHSEKLPRTPFTASLLLSILINSVALAPNSSKTTILEQYVGLLLGRGDPHEDARFDIDMPGREAVLASLAQLYIEKASPSLPEGEVVSHISAVFDRFSWAESATALLQNFIDRGVLRGRSGRIEFARSSYLHLFAAKRAGSNPGFLKQLLRTPLYFDQEIKAHAALTRNDVNLLRELELLLSQLNVDHNHSSRALEEVPKAPSHDENGSQRVISANRSVGLKPEADLPELPDHSLNDELLPPNKGAEVLPEGLRLLRTLDLVSSVLRDTDQVEDLDLKVRMLGDVLRHWSLLIGVLENDNSFRELVRSLAEEFFDQEVDADNRASERRMDWLYRAIPAAVSIGAMDATLSSRKLIRAFRQLLDSDDWISDSSARIGAAFFLMTLHDKGWPARLSEVLNDEENRWIVQSFLLNLCLEAYASAKVDPSDDDALIELCVKIVTKGTRYSSKQAEASHVIDLRKQIRGLRARKVSDSRMESIERPPTE